MPSPPPRKVDALIIGGGIIGLSIGYYLSRRNFSNVEIIEREPELTMHASGHNAGGISSIHVYQPHELWPLLRETQKLFRELSESPGFQFEYSGRGTTTPGTPDEEMKFRKTAVEFEDGNEGVHVEFIDKEELRKREPYVSTDRFSCALFYPLDAQGNSKKLGECFSRTCLEKGMKITTGSTITGFEISRGRVVRAMTGDHTPIAPDVVIVAAGPWSGQVSASLGLDLPISPVKGHLISVETGDLTLVNSFISGPQYYVMQNGTTAIVGGGEDESGFNVEVDQVRVREAWAEGVSMVPKLGSLDNNTFSTACLRPHARGGIPILGKSELLENVYFATGHFRSGFGLAPVTGKLIAQLVIEGRSEIDLAPFSPDRFLP
jgi:glycine oxidase